MHSNITLILGTHRNRSINRFTIMSFLSYFSFSYIDSHHSKSIFQIFSTSLLTLSCSFTTSSFSLISLLCKSSKNGMTLIANDSRSATETTQEWLNTSECDCEKVWKFFSSAFDIWAIFSCKGHLGKYFAFLNDVTDIHHVCISKFIFLFLHISKWN